MAGFFGLFNYDKEGPGVPKDGPKKKTFIVFFEIFFRNFWKFIPINLVYWLITLPLLSNGLANVGLTNVARNTARDKHSFGLSDFFETIKKNWKQALFAGIINTIIFALLIFDVGFFWGIKGTYGIICTGVSLALLTTFTIMNYYLWTLIITFNYTLKQAYTNSFKLAFLNFKYSFLCLLINVVIFALGFIIPIFWLQKISFYVILVELLLLLLVYPGFNAMLIQFCTFPCIKKFIIDPYYKEHPDEDIEKRRRLGLDIEGDKEAPTEDNPENEDDSEAVFED